MQQAASGLGPCALPAALPTAAALRFFADIVFTLQASQTAWEQGVANELLPVHMRPCTAARAGDALPCGLTAVVLDPRVGGNYLAQACTTRTYGPPAGLTVTARGAPVQPPIPARA